MSAKEQIISILDCIDENDATQILVFAQSLQPTLKQRYDNYSKQVVDLIEKKNIPVKTLDVNEKGHIVIDKDKDPDLYDWAVNG